MTKEPQTAILSESELSGLLAKLDDPSTPPEQIREISDLLEELEAAADTITSYERKRQRSIERERKQSRAGREIGQLAGIDYPLPPEIEERRAAAGDSFRLHCETYAPETFHMAWSQDHLDAISRIETSVLDGGLFALAMPRGSGKTSLAEQAVIWSLLNAHARFIMLLAATGQAAEQLLANIRMALETNERLLADYPEICQPIAALEGIRQRRLLHNGRLIRMEFTKDRISLPWIEGSPAAGGTVRCSGLTGAFRGARVVLPDGTSLRPDFVLIDDPQTHESAKSPTQCHNRARILAEDVQGLAGPGKQIAGVMPCTVVAEGDLADTHLDRSLKPEWNGQRTKMLVKWPERMDLWELYREKRLDGLREQENTEAADAFYLENREAMDAGAIVSWPARINPGDVSALQTAMNLWIKDPESFASEYQNEPIRASTMDDEVRLLTAKEITEKTNGLPRGKVMDGCTAVTAFIDVQDKCLWWAVCAWRPDFTGHLVDWNAFPDQGRNYFTMNDIRKTLQRARQGVGLTGAMTWALGKLTDQLFTTSWEREDGEPMQLDLCLIDANYQTETVRDFCRRQKRGKLVSPDHGRYYGAAAVKLSEKKRAKGESIGEEWKTSRIRRQLHILHDSNYWKSEIQELLTIPLGDPGSFTLPGRPARELNMVADHLTAEFRTRVTADKGSRRTVDEWKLPPSKPDNHLLDCISGCAVAASICRCKRDKQRKRSQAAAPPDDDSPDDQPKKKKKKKKPAADQPGGRKRKRRRWRLG